MLPAWFISGSVGVARTINRIHFAQLNFWSISFTAITFISVVSSVFLLFRTHFILFCTLTSWQLQVEKRGKKIFSSAFNCLHCIHVVVEYLISMPFIHLKYARSQLVYIPESINTFAFRLMPTASIRRFLFGLVGGGRGAAKTIHQTKVFRRMNKCKAER